MQGARSGCCTMVSPHCVDQYGASGHALRDELVLNERQG